MRKIWMVLMLGLLLPTLSFADTVKLLPSAVLDGETNSFKPGWGVVVKDGFITEVGPVRSLSSTDTTQNLEGLSLIPGLIENHSHVLLHPYDETGWNDQVLKESFAERAIRGGKHATANLMAGFTTLRDLGSEGAEYVDVGVRDAINKGVVDGPRLLVAGKAIVATGSYGPKGFSPHFKPPLGAEEADGDDLRRITRDQIGHGIDWVKVYADYRWGPNGEARPTFSIDELKTIVEVAASSGRQTVAHASTNEAMRRATLAGVRTIEHGDGGTLETFKLMAERGVAWCPTLAASEAIAEYQGWVKGKDTPPNRVTEQQTAFNNALKAGVTMCMGSDIGVYDHGDNVLEMELMVDYGMETKDVLQSATSINANILNMADKIGSLKVGLEADIIAVRGNPHDDISNLKNVEFVMKMGKIYKGNVK